MAKLEQVENFIDKSESYKNKNTITFDNESKILKGNIISINEERLQVCIDGCRSNRIDIPLEEAGLYIPYRLKNDPKKLKYFLEDYLGNNISFMYDGKKHENNKTIVQGSIIKARRQTIKRLKETIGPITIKVNILIVKEEYMVIEYYGIIQTVGWKNISRLTGKSLKDYYIATRNIGRDLFIFNKIENDITGEMNICKLSRISERFKEKINNGFYVKKDYCSGIVIGFDEENKALIQIDEDIIALGSILQIENNDIEIGDIVSGLIGNLDKCREIIFMWKVKKIYKD